MSRLLGLLLLLLVEAAIVTFLYINREEKENQVSERTLSSLKIAYNAALQSRDTIMRMTMQETLLRHDVVAMFARGVWPSDQDELDNMREKLYRSLLPSYQRLVNEGVQQLHFHTKEGRSYLRLHQPDHYGDDLMLTRPAVAKLNETLQPVKGFEVAYGSIGYRFVYPVFLNQQRLGSVEMGFSFDALRNLMVKLAPHHDFMFFIHERTKQSMSAQQAMFYQPSRLNKHYLIADLPSTISKDASDSMAATNMWLQQQLSSIEKVQQAMQEGRSIATHVWANGNWYSVALLPIVDINNQLVAYVVSASISPEIASIQGDFWVGVGVSGLLMFLLAVFLWRTQSEAQWRREQQYRMQVITDTMADGLYVTDHQGAITFVNPATVSLLGYEASVLEGCLARELFYINAQGERGIEAKDCPLCRVLLTGTPFQGEWRFMRHDGSTFDAEVASQPIVQSDNLIGAVIVFRDVSARNAAKEIIAARALAEQASAAKSAFLANMSHEIRTPMNGVLGMTALLQETPLNAEQSDYVQTIRSSGDALLTIIDDILDYSKIEAGMMTIESVPVDLRDLFKDIQRLMQVRVKQKGLTLSLSVPDVVPRMVLTDGVRVRQILLNLIGNAIKFTEKGGVEVLALLTQQEGDRMMLRVEVTDTGIGIASDKVGRLFKSFSQADDSTSRRFGGTGLGLSISKRLAELMQGEMGVSSVEGQGSVFWFTFVVCEAKDEQPKALSTADVAADLPPARILLVEDNLINQKVAVAMLGKLGYKPVVANNGEEALSILAEQDFDLIFMDCQMPVMDGFEATRAIRAGIANGSPNITVIALTANAMKEDQDACYASGMTDYLSKPLQMPVLITMLKKHLVAAPEPTS